MSAAGPRVIVVDDDPALLDALPAFMGLRLPELRVDVCDSAPRAAALIRKVDYDAVITDIKMPVMDGLALLADARQVRPDTPVLLLTGHGEHELTVQALRHGAFDFIVKPIDREYFIAALTRALDVRALRREVTRQKTALEEHARELELVVERRTQELLRANHAKDEFLGLISHEMRTPLTVIAGGLQVLRARAATLADADREDLMRDLVQESERLTKMVEDLLVLARSEAYAVHAPEPVSIGPMLERLAKRMAHLTGRHIQIDVADRLPLVAGELTFLERVVENLISNAIKYSPVTTPVEISAGTCPAGAVEVCVSDHGIGVEPAELERIFENFYRSGEARERVAGHGVGLAVCKRLVEALSGTIEATARAGGGLRVRFTIPVYGEETPPEASLPEPAATPA